MGGPTDAPGDQQRQGRIRLLIPAADIAARRDALAARISHDYAGRELVMVSILKGSLPFFVDLGRALTIPVTYDTLGVSSYGDGTEPSDRLELTADLSGPVEGKHVLVVEDIVDTGRTVSHVLARLAERRPASVKLAALLDKPSRRRMPVRIDYLGFTVSDHFVVGYGLDHGQRHRNLPYIGVIGDPGGESEPWARAGD